MTKLKFTDACIAALLKDGVETQTRIPGPNSLYVSVNTNGTATFALRYTDKRLNPPKQRPYKFAAWHQTDYKVEQALIDAASLRNKIAGGTYPDDNAKLMSGTSVSGSGIKFETLVDAYIDWCKEIIEKKVPNRPSEKIKRHRMKTWKQVRYLLGRAKDYIGDRYANTLTADEIGALLDSFSSNRISNNVRQNMIALSKWARRETNQTTRKPYLSVNWFANFEKEKKEVLGLRKRLKVATKGRDRVPLPTEKQPIAILWRALREDENCPGSIHTRRALALILCTALRPGNVRILCRRHVIDIDSDNPRLYFNPHETKMGRYMVVPLNGFAVEIIKEALEHAKHPNDVLFPGRDGVSVMPGETLSRLMRGGGPRWEGISGYLGWSGTAFQVTPHALRRTASAMLRAKGFGYTPADIAFLLDHQSETDDDNEVTAGYSDDFTIDDDEGDDFHWKRVDLAEALEKALRAVLDPKPTSSDNVVPLRSRAA